MTSSPPEPGHEAGARFPGVRPDGGGPFVRPQIVELHGDRRASAPDAPGSRAAPEAADDGQPGSRSIPAGTRALLNLALAAAGLADPHAGEDSKPAVETVAGPEPGRVPPPAPAQELPGTPPETASLPPDATRLAAQALEESAVRGRRLPAQQGAERAADTEAAPAAAGRDTDATRRHAGAPTEAQAGEAGRMNGAEGSERPARPASETLASRLDALRQFGEDPAAQTRMAPAETVNARLAIETAGAAHRPNPAVLAAQIATRAANGARSFEIQLDPPELGRIDVRLEIARDGRVVTHLAVERADTLDALLRDARGLERALQASGLRIEDGGIHYELRDQSAFGREQRGHNAGPRDGAPGQGQPAADAETEPGGAPPPGTGRRISAGIDITV